MNERTRNEMEMGFEMDDEQLLRSINDDFVNNFEELIFGFRKTVIAIMRLAGVWTEEVYSDDQIDVCYPLHVYGLHRQVGVVFFPLSVLLEDQETEYVIKLSLDIHSFMIKGAILEDLNNPQIIKYFAYDDWTDKDNPVLVFTGQEDNCETDLSKV